MASSGPCQLPPISDWTFEAVLELVAREGFETGCFDFKAGLTGSNTERQKLQSGISWTAGGFANSDRASVLIFGIEDRATGKSPRDRIVGVSCTGDLRKQFHDIIASIHPSIDFETVPQPIPIPGSDRCIFIVEIPTSRRGPYMVDGRFPVRTAGGSTAELNWDRVSERMRFNHERCAALLRLKIVVDRARARVNEIETIGLGHFTRITKFDPIALRMALDSAAVAISVEPELFDLLESLIEAEEEVNRVIDYCYRAKGADHFAKRKFEEKLPAAISSVTSASDLIAQILSESDCARRE